MDVEDGTDDAGAVLMFIEQPGGMAGDPANGAVLVAKAELEAELLFTPDALAPLLAHPLVVVRMHRQQPAETLAFSLGAPRQRAPTVVDEDDVTLGVCAEDAGGGRVRDGLEGLPGLIDLGRGLLAALDVPPQEEEQAGRGNADEAEADPDGDGVELAGEQPVRSHEPQEAEADEGCQQSAEARKEGTHAGACVEIRQPA